MASSVLRRALLYVPSSSQKMLAKSRNLKVDTIAYDLEDSVTLSNKSSARQALASFLSQDRPSHISEVAVRVNAVETGLALDDLTAVLNAPNLDAIVVPKVNSAADLHFITDVIKHFRKDAADGTRAGRAQLRIIALIESAKAVMNLHAICGASPYLSGLVFAAEDFAHDLSITRTPSLTEFLYARSAVVTAARAFDLPSTIDLVCTAYKGEAGLKTLETECIGGKSLGFNGKQCIHPSQVNVVQSTFAPSDEEVEWAVRVVIADEKADDAGRGAWTLEGKMIDVPVVRKAKSLVEKAEQCGIDIHAKREQWKHQEPE